MSLLYITLIALIQGITEFLPVSSSGHLVLLPHLLNEQDQGLMIDIAVHFGTLLAVIAYFFRDTFALAIGGIDFLRGKKSADRHLFILILIATCPVIFAGFIMHEYLPNGLRAIEIIGWSTLIFGLLLGWSDSAYETSKTTKDLTLKSALFIGLMQILALIPGTSRSGITITAARFLKLNRVEASRFALLLGIPTILGASILGFYDLYKTDNLIFQQDAFIAIGLSFVAAYISIWALMRFAKQFTFFGFMVYRILLGGGILAYVYLW